MSLSDANKIEGDGRASENQQQRLRIAMRAGWPEIPRNRLKFGPRGLIEDTATGDFFGVYKGEVDPQLCPVAAYYIAPAGDPVFLEPPPGPRNRDELAAQRAAHEQRRAERMKPRARR